MSNNSYKDIAIAKADDVLDESNEFMFKVYKECMRWEESETELSQGRSNFQIEKFIIHDNFTIPSAFKAAIVNRKSVAENLLQSVQEAKRAAREFYYKWEDKDKSKPIWWKNGRGGEDLCWYDIDEFNFHRLINNLNQGFKATVDELKFFDQLIEKLIELNGGKPITKEQFDQDQPTYWQRRLSNQALDDLLQSQTGVSAGNIRSMRRASAPTVLDDDLNRTKEEFGDPNNYSKFLDTLQNHVAKGIEEISGLNSLILEPEKVIDKSNHSTNIFEGSSLFNENFNK